MLNKIYINTTIFFRNQIKPMQKNSDFYEDMTNKKKQKIGLNDEILDLRWQSPVGRKKSRYFFLIFWASFRVIGSNSLKTRFSNGTWWKQLTMT